MATAARLLSDLQIKSSLVGNAGNASPAKFAGDFIVPLVRIFNWTQFPDHVDLWVIKKSLWSFARVVRQDHVNTERGNSLFIPYSLYDYQSWKIHFGGIHKVR